MSLLSKSYLLLSMGYSVTKIFEGPWGQYETNAILAYVKADLMPSVVNDNDGIQSAQHPYHQIISGNWLKQLILPRILPNLSPTPSHSWCQHCHQLPGLASGTQCHTYHQIVSTLTGIGHWIFHAYIKCHQSVLCLKVFTYIWPPTHLLVC